MVKANLKGGASLIHVVSQLTTEGLNFVGQYVNGELLHNGLFGGADNDTLDANGGRLNIPNDDAGNDKLLDGLGNESYAFKLGFGVNTI